MPPPNGRGRAGKYSRLLAFRGVKLGNRERGGGRGGRQARQTSRFNATILGRQVDSCIPRAKLARGIEYGRCMLSQGWDRSCDWTEFER